MKKKLLIFAAALVIGVAACFTFSPSFEEAVRNLVCAAIVVGITVFFVGGYIYSVRADEEVTRQLTQ